MPLGELSGPVRPQRVAEAGPGSAIVRRPARDFGCDEDEALAGLPLQRLTDGERAGVEVDRIPSEPERLALA